MAEWTGGKTGFGDGDVRISGEREGNVHKEGITKNSE